MTKFLRLDRTFVPVAIAMLAGSSINAQRPAPPPIGPRTLVGIVSDTSGNPVDSVEVFITSVKRRAMSSADGTGGQGSAAR